MKRALSRALTAVILVAAASAFAAPAESVQLARALAVASPAQAGIKDLLEKGYYQQALEQWDAAYGRTRYPETAGGRAFHALLLFRNDLQSLAVNELFSIPDPQNIPAPVKKLWASELPFDHDVWRQLDVAWSPKWRAVFPAQVEDAVLAWNSTLPRTQREMDADSALLSRLSAENPARSHLLWILGLGKGVNGQTAQALNYFQELLDSDQNVVPTDEIYLASARLFFQDGKFAAAMKYYDMVPKDSDFWLEAVEEKAWTDVRLGQYASALSRVKTLMVPFFAGQLGPEPYYLSGLANIRVCDFASVFEMLKTFKERFKGRVGVLQQIASQGATPAVNKALDQLELDGTIAGLAGEIGELPRNYQRDESLLRWAARARVASGEIKTLAGFQGLENLKSLARREHDSARRLSVSRMKTLAKRDEAELKTNLTKLHVVEIEAIQRMYPHVSTQKLSKAAAVKRKAVATTDAVETFPADGEVWLDELSHYKVDVKGCPAPGGQSL